MMKSTESGWLEALKLGIEVDSVYDLNLWRIAVLSTPKYLC